MNGIKFISRKMIFPVLYKVGFDKILRSLSHNSNLSIMYHGVVERDSNYFSARHIEKSQFEEQIMYLKNEFEIISLKEASDRKNESQIKSGKKSISISFDDGYLNNLQIALPILEKHKVKATFFISSICCESNGYILWSDLIAALNYFYKDTIIELSNKKFKNLTTLSGDLNIYDYIKSLDYNERDHLINELCEQYYLYDRINSLPDEIWKIMNAKQLKELSGSSNFYIPKLDEKKDTVSLTYLTMKGDTIRTYSSFAKEDRDKLKVKKGGDMFTWRVDYPVAKKFDGMILWWGSLNGPTARLVTIKWF